MQANYAPLTPPKNALSPFCESYGRPALTLKRISEPANSSAPLATLRALSLSVMAVRSRRPSRSRAVSVAGSTSPGAGGRPSSTSWAWGDGNGLGHQEPHD